MQGFSIPRGNARVGDACVGDTRSWGYLSRVFSTVRVLVLKFPGGALLPSIHPLPQVRNYVLNRRHFAWELMHQINIFRVAIVSFVKSERKSNLLHICKGKT